MSGPVDTAQVAWAGQAPEWVMALAAECASSSQNRVAVRMGRSASLVSQVLRNKYPGDLTAVEEAFNGAFRSITIACPALGPISPRACGDWRRSAAAFHNTNAMRVRMYRACHRCPRFKGETK